jgi:hypothetical protein
MRLSLPVVSEEMEAWSTALADEVTGWPHVITRAFFGLTALYRKEKIFALLPRTRGMGMANSLAFKLESRTSAVLDRLEQDPRIATTQMHNTRWFTFQVSSDSDLHNALDWLGRAYEAAGKNNKSH